MSDLINILPDNVANQIAAGEVVDRPASAVKELLENAIDAGASHVQLIVKDAGRTLLQVIDDGCGMSDSDARLCFERHATSKVHVADDLFRIHTMGFRGEALASIAAIAHVELRTRMHDADLGTLVNIEGCKILGQETCSCAAGTSLSVKNLFFNVPARRNFLKKDSVELGHIEEIFRRVVLANCGVEFSFYSNGKLLYDLKHGNLLQRICQLYGDNYKERFFRVEEQNEMVAVKGYVGKPEFARKSRGEQYLFVNNRFIKHPALSAAIEKAYTGVIPDRYYPSYFLSLTVDPSRIDVNIHPTKTEVKFIDEHALFSLLRAAVRKSIGQFSLATELDFTTMPEFDFPPAPSGYTPQQPSVSIDTTYNPFDALERSQRQPSAYKPQASGGGASGGGQCRWNELFDSGSPAALPSQQELAQQPGSIIMDSRINSVDSGNQLSDISTQQLAGNALLQVQNRWIVSNMQSGFLVVDQQRASERVVYERLLNQKQQAEGGVAGQGLLFPVNVSFSPADADIFGELLDDVRRGGFAVEPLSGRGLFVVTATPPDISDDDLQALFDQMITDYKSSMLQKFYNSNESVCRSMARRLAYKYGRQLFAEEMHQLIADLFSCHTPQVSPDGKKTMAIVNLETLF